MNLAPGAETPPRPTETPPRPNGGPKRIDYEGAAVECIGEAARMIERGNGTTEQVEISLRFAQLYATLALVQEMRNVKNG